MLKKYNLVTDEKRLLLIHLIHIKGLTIASAAKQAQISYPTAKTINAVYKKEKRITKKGLKQNGKRS